MPDVVIHAEGLGKKYIIGHETQREAYASLRDVIARRSQNFLRKARDMVHGRPIIEGDELEEVWVLRDVSFTVKRGDVVGIVGRNGAGKSTLLKILSRITEPSAGRVQIRGRVASLLEVGTGFHPELSARENIFLNGAILGMSRADVKGKFDAIVEFAEVERFLDTPVKRYSSGMYVRLAFAVAAHLESDVLMIDEVLAVGDARFQRKCLGKMHEVSGSGRTVLFVSHNLNYINKVCARSILIDKGGIALDGGTDTVLKSYLSMNSSSDGESDGIVKPQMRRYPETTTIWFRTCYLTGLDDRPQRKFAIGEDFRIEIAFDSEMDGAACFWILLVDASGNYVACSHQKDYMQVVVQKGKRYLITHTTNGVSLLPGVYSVWAGAMNESYAAFHEFVENCQTFEVSPVRKNGDPYDGRSGYFELSSRWDITPR